MLLRAVKGFLFSAMLMAMERARGSAVLTAAQVVS